MNNNNSCQITSERIDDVVLLLNVMKEMGLPEIINQHLSRHWKEKGLDWGWVTTIWLSYILSQGDHRKVKVREWVNQRSYTLEKVGNLSLRETDFTDDRLSILLRRLSPTNTWSADDGQEQILGTGYELEREQEISIHGVSQTWRERVFLIRSQSYLDRQKRGLETRLEKALEKLLALTPPVARGKRQIRDELELCQKAEQILKTHRVEGLLDYEYNYEVPTRHRPGRYQITAVKPNRTAIQQVEQQLGWRAYVTNAPPSRLSLPQAVLTYRDEWIAERSFHRLKGAPLSLSPFFVQRDDQVKGLVHLLGLAVRILTLIEFVVGRSLKKSGEFLLGLYPGNPLKATQRPTAEKLLEAFKNLTLTLFHIKIEYYTDVTELNSLQNKILLCLGLSPDIYSGLVENST